MFSLIPVILFYFNLDQLLFFISYLDHLISHLGVVFFFLGGGCIIHFYFLFSVDNILIYYYF